MYSQFDERIRLIMGYESKLYVVTKHSSALKGEKPWGQVVATFDLCKFPPVADYMRKCSPTDCYILAEDGNTVITEDRYDKPLTESELSPIIEILEEASKDTSFGGHPYRRIKPILAMLKAFEENNGQWGNLRVLHFGH